MVDGACSYGSDVIVGLPSGTDKFVIGKLFSCSLLLFLNEHNRIEALQANTCPVLLRISNFIIRSRMCYKGKCLYCIPVENGCLAIAIMSALFTGLALVGSLVSGVLVVAGVIVTTQAIHSGRMDFSQFRDDPDMRIMGEAAVTVAGIAVGIFIAILAVASLIAFIFSVLLCNGICNRRPGQVKAYFVYGVVITVLAVLASVVQLCVDQEEPAPGIMGLLGCVIYSLFLVLVHQTYAKLLEGTVFAVKGGHMRLVES